MVRCARIVLLTGSARVFDVIVCLMIYALMQLGAARNSFLPDVKVFIVIITYVQIRDAACVCVIIQLINVENSLRELIAKVTPRP